MDDETEKRRRRKKNRNNIVGDVGRGKSTSGLLP
jgi:hypothetical protein